jgi:large subunit ribosomal protein L10
VPREEGNPRPEKVAVVEEVRGRFDSSAAALLTEYRGLNVAAMAELRRALRAAGGDYKIYKNTLVRFAARDLGLELDDLLLGPTAIAFVEGDPVNVAKALRDFSRTNPALIIKGGLLGESVLDADGARALADVEPREVLLARLAGAMAAPLQQFAGLLQALPRNLAYGLQALIDQKAESGEQSAPEEAAPADETPAADEAPAASDETPAAEAATPSAADPADDETPAAEAADATQES